MSWRRRLGKLAVFVVVFLLVLTLFDVFVFERDGGRFVMCWHGRRVCSIEDVRMIMEQRHLNLLEDCVMCGMPKYPHCLVMTTYDRQAALSVGESIGVF